MFIPYEVVRLWEDARGVHGRFGVFWHEENSGRRYSSTDDERRARDDQTERNDRLRVHIDTAYDCRAVAQSRTMNVCWLAERPDRVGWARRLLARLDSLGVDSIPSPLRPKSGVDGWSVVVEFRSAAGYRAYHYWMPDSASTDAGERAAARVSAAVAEAFKDRLATRLGGADASKRDFAPHRSSVNLTHPACPRSFALPPPRRQCSVDSSSRS